MHQTIILLFIPVSTIGIILLQFSYFIRITTQTQSMLFAAIVCYSLLILANIVVFYYIDNMEEMVAKDLTISTAGKLIDMQTEQYQTIIDNQNQTFKLQHDYKNFLLGIINDINNKNYNEALADLDSQYQLFSKGSSPDSGINIIHTVINNKRKAAEQSGITIDFEYHNLSKIVISSVDIAILLGNALDNAIEATQKVTDLQNKKITVFAQLKNNTIVLKISNPVNEQIDTNNLRSTKKEKAYHGYGIASMNNIVKKHKGSLVFACSNLMFETVITLNNSAIVNECAEKDNERAV